MKNVLITGAFGFLGRHTAKTLKESGSYNITGIGHGKWASYEYKAWGIDEWYNSTITFEALININKRFDIIIHCGGSGSVSFSYENPYEDFQKTVQSTLSLLEYIRLQCKGCHFIYPSSPAVQGDVGDISIKETEPAKPVSPYGFHKRAAEELCHSYSKNFEVNITIIRFFSIYGPGLQKQLLWDACLKILNSSGDVTFFGTGEETRDWVNIADASALMKNIIDEKKNNNLEIINCGSGRRVTIKKTLETLIKLYKPDILLKFNSIVKEGDPRYYQADITKAQTFGFRVTKDLEQGLTEYVEFFKEIILRQNIK